MKVDLDYMGSLFDVFIRTESAHIDWDVVKEAGISVSSEANQVDEKFLFHIQLAAEQQLISNSDMNCSGLKSIGIISLKSKNGEEFMPGSAKVRLTSKGHDFAKSLNNSEVLGKLKSEFKDAPFDTVFRTGQKLLEHYFKTKLDTLTND